MKALSLFNGISGLHLALDRAGIKVDTLYYAEIDKFANKVTETQYPNDIPLGDVTKWEDWDIDWSEIGLVTAGFPCFTETTQVLTSQGYKSIKDVNIGDLVVTHTNNWQPVTAKFHKENYVWEVKAQGVLTTETTEEHPYLVSEMTRINGKRTFSTPEWVEVKNLNKNHFVCFPKIEKECNPLNLSEEDCYILGRYVADGHTAKHLRKEKGREGERFWNLILSVGSHKIPKIETKHCLHKHGKSVHRMVFCNKRLVEIAEKYLGVGSINKEIPPIFLELPKNLLELFLNGLLDGDGSDRDGLYRLTSISQKLVMSLNLAIMKVYGVVGNITKTFRPKTTTIEGRVVNQKDTYTISFTKEVRKQKHYHEIEKLFLAPIKSVKNTGVIDDVYNIEVATDNSYTANNAVVHNCQAWSIAGKGLGDKDERGMLFWTTLDIISKVIQNNPKAKFILENVKMKKEFEDYITHHTSQALGEVTKTLINSALVSAQNRNRFYWTNFEVSQPQDKGLVISDIVEDNQDLNFGKEVIGVGKNYIQWDNSGKGYGSQDQRGYYLLGKHGTLSTGSSKNKIVVGLETSLKNESIMKNGKSYVLTASYAGAVAWNSCERKQRTMLPVSLSDEEMPNVYNGVLYRKLSPVECERLQNIPDNFTDCISNSQRYKAIGNGWTIDVIAHILKCANLKKGD